MKWSRKALKMIPFWKAVTWNAHGSQRPLLHKIKIKSSLKVSKKQRKSGPSQQMKPPLLPLSPSKNSTSACSAINLPGCLFDDPLSTNHAVLFLSRADVRAVPHRCVNHPSFHSRIASSSTRKSSRSTCLFSNRHTLTLKLPVIRADAKRHPAISRLVWSTYLRGERTQSSPKVSAAHKDPSELNRRCK